MAFKVVKVSLAAVQVDLIREGVGETGEDNYALLAEPKPNEAMLNIQVLTEQQHDIIRRAILKAHKLPEWKSKIGAGDSNDANNP